MNEKHTTLEVIAPSVDEAIAQGLADLGLPAEAVDVEVLDAGSKGLFGIGGRQVRVRITVKGVETPGTPSLPAKNDESIPADDTTRLAEQTVLELLEKMHIPASVRARLGEPDESGERPVYVDISGDDLGILIGRRAEILNALQFIVNLIVSKQVEHWVQIVVDVEGYRVRRERQLRQMARRMADQAVKTGRRQILEPMSAAERRIIHLELRDRSEVTTVSIGEEPGRKVTISPK